MSPLENPIERNADIPTLNQVGSEIFRNPDKRFSKWRWTPMTSASAFPIALAANEVREVDVQLGGERGVRGDTEYDSFLLTSTGRVAVRPYVASPIDKYLSNVPIPSSLMFGTSLLPGLLPTSLYCSSKSFWKVQLTDLSAAPNTVSAVLGGRRTTRSKNTSEEVRRHRAEKLISQVWPYWVGPQDQQAAFTGPQVTLAAGATVTLRFPVPEGFFYLAKWILDDSTSTTGLEPVLTAQLHEENTERELVDAQGALGLSWRDFIACPTSLGVAGLPSGGFFRAMSFGSPRTGWTHLFRPRSALAITFVSNDAGVITLRPALAGWLIHAKEASA